jgi:hypothetical protein
VPAVDIKKRLSPVPVAAGWRTAQHLDDRRVQRHVPGGAPLAVMTVPTTSSRSDIKPGQGECLFDAQAASDEQADQRLADRPATAGESADGCTSASISACEYRCGDGLGFDCGKQIGWRHLARRGRDGPCRGEQVAGRTGSGRTGSLRPAVAGVPASCNGCSPTRAW